MKFDEEITKNILLDISETISTSRHSRGEVEEFLSAVFERREAFEGRTLTLSRDRYPSGIPGYAPRRILCPGQVDRRGFFCGDSGSIVYERL